MCRVETLFKKYFGYRAHDIEPPLNPQIMWKMVTEARSPRERPALFSPQENVTVLEIVILENHRSGTFPHSIVQRELEDGRRQETFIWGRFSGDEALTHAQHLDSSQWFEAE